MHSHLRADNINGVSRWSKSGNCFCFLVEIRLGNLAGSECELLNDCGRMMISGENEAEKQKVEP